MDEDRISKLPEHVLHHVLSFIPTIKGCVQTSVLSRSWRHLWSTKPSFFLDESLFREDDEDDGLTFQHVVYETLQGYIDRNLRLDEFSLRYKSQTAEHVLFPDLLYDWVPRVLSDMQVTKFSLTRIQPSNIFLRMADHLYLDLLHILDSFHSDHLRHLHLDGCLLHDPIDGRLRVENLLELHLSDVSIADHNFEKILLSCPLLETVHAIYCKELGSVTLTKQLVPRLKNLSLLFEDEPHSNSRLKIHDDVPTLQEIEISHCPKWRSHCPSFHNLKSLSLEKVRLPTGWLDGFSTNFPRVERLDFSDCYGFKKILQLSSSSIKELKLIVTPPRAWKISIDAPNITEFTYQGLIPRSLCFAATNSGEWRTSRMNLSVEKGDGDWFLELTRVLKAVSSRSKIYLTLAKHDEDPVGHVFRKPRLVELEELCLMVSGHSSSSLSDFIIGLLPSLRPREIVGCRYYQLDEESLSDVEAFFSDADEMENNNQLTETLCKILLGDDDTTGEVCYLKRGLEEVVLEASYPEDEGEGWRRVHATTTGTLTLCDALTLLNKCEQRQLRFRLRWRS